MFHSPPAAQKRTRASTNVSPARSPIRTRSVAKAQHAHTSPNEQGTDCDANLNSCHSNKSKSSKLSQASKKSVERQKLQLKIARNKIQQQDLQLQLAELELTESIADPNDLPSRHTESLDSKEKVKNWMEHSMDPFELPQNEDNELRPDTTVVINPPGPSEIQQLASALKDAFRVAATDAKNETMLARIGTTKDLPLFFGEPMEWLQFKQTYMESTKQCKFSDAENLWRLRKCLRGEAKETVSALLMGHTPAATIIDALDLRFGRPELIIGKLVNQLKKTAPLPAAYHNELVKFAIKIKNYVTAVQALKQEDFLRSPELLIAALSKCPSSLIIKWADYYALLPADEIKPKIELFSEFLHDEAKKTAAAGISHIFSQTDFKKKLDERKPTHSYNAQICHTLDSDSTEVSCKYCKKDKHTIISCPRFKKALRRDRWRFVKRQKLCYKCIAGYHRQDTCPAPECDIEECNKPHHRMLHWPIKKARKQQDDDDDEKSEKSEMVAHAVSEKFPKLLLKVVPIVIHGPKKRVKTYALLDDGAAFSLMSADVAEEAGLQGVTQTINAKSAWSSSKITCNVELVNCDISNTEDERFHLRARVMKELELCTQELTYADIKGYAHLRHHDHVVSYCGNVKPKVLIGHDHYHLIAPQEILRGRKDEPYASKTSLGWCVHGLISSVNSKEISSKDATVLHVNTNDELMHEEVKQSFALDAIGISTKPRQNTEHLQAVSILEATSKLVNGRWIVGLPWKSEVKLPESYFNACKRLRAVEKKMQANTQYAVRYKERIEHLLVNDFAEELKNSEACDKDNLRVWYLPHFGVDNPNKKKLRLVFDAAAKSSDHSLNDYLLQGPDLLQSLLGIMMRFREESVGIIGDIKDMFLRIKIMEKDQHALRFLWRDHPIDPIKKYTMTSLIFGANCSPFIAQFIKNKNALRFQNEMPKAVDAIINSHYMDDYVDSQREDDAKKLVQEIINIHAKGGFEIRNFLSNNKNVLRSISKTAINEKAVELNLENQSERTLGLLWYPATDTFGFDLSMKRIPDELLSLKRRPTKRELLRIVMSIFDVYGFLAPFTVKAKILLQATWKDDIKWDDMIREDLFPPLKDWISDLVKLREIRIPRWYFGSSLERSDDISTTYELHVLCDASPTAYAAVAYWRILSELSDKTTRIRTAFIASKCRVAPLKSVSVPRLELQAALLGSRLAETIQLEHRLRIEKRYFWTDSTVVLHWIRNDTKNYKTFVANRLGEIDSLTKLCEWHYIPTSVNTADCATKISNYELCVDCNWLRGPDFLQDSCITWPSDPVTDKIIDNDVLEVHNVFNIITADLPVPEPKRFSSWMRLLRSTAAVLLFIERCKKSLNHTAIDCDLMKQAEVQLLKYSQIQTFSCEIACLAQGKQIERNSRLRMLSPYLDKKIGLLRVDGRIGAVKDVDIEVNNPIILDGRDYITRLIVQHFHIQAAHGCNEMIVNQLRQKYWLINLRPTVRTVSSKCLVCRIKRAKPSVPRMADLPEARLAHHQRAFTHCGVDLFGPMEITVGRRREKRYGVLFTCMTVRAVHIEVVPSLSTDSFIMALRRMASRRGWPQQMYSDNGTNLRGADIELRKSFKELDQIQIQEEMTNRGVTWFFLSPISPHKGGAWERLIRSVKTALRVILKERAPREETLITLLTEIENIINSRPLTHVSVDPKYMEAITPNHFLIGSSSNVPIPGVFNDGDLILRKMWRTSQRLTDLFWKRWIKEVLPNLLTRQKWYEEGGHLKPGDLVVIVDPDAPRNTWSKGIVKRGFPGADGRVRTVQIAMKNGVLLTRPVARLALIPVATE